MALEVKIKKKIIGKNNCSIIPGELNTFLFANQDKPMPPEVVQSVREQSINILCSFWGKRSYEFNFSNHENKLLF